MGVWADVRRALGFTPGDGDLVVQEAIWRFDREAELEDSEPSQRPT